MKLSNQMLTVKENLQHYSRKGLSKTIHMHPRNLQIQTDMISIANERHHIFCWLQHTLSSTEL